MEVRIIENFIPAEDLRWLIVIAFDDHEIIGTCQLGNWKWDVPNLHSLHVAEPHRRKGVASLLIAACIRHSAAAGKTSIGLCLSKKNVEAKALYDKLGFVAYSDDEKMIWMGVRL